MYAFELTAQEWHIIHILSCFIDLLVTLGIYDCLEHAKEYTKLCKWLY